MLLFFPLIKLITPVIGLLPLPEQSIDSIQHHLLLGRTVQVVFLVYLTAILCLTYFSKNQTNKINTIKYAVIIGLILIVCLYQYYYVLNRMRSYFLPFIIIYTINSAYEYFKDNNKLLPYSTLLKQLSILFIFIYVSYFTYTIEKTYSQTISQFYDRTTIFELRHHSKAEIRARQLKKAETYWLKDFFRNAENVIKNTDD